MNLTKLLRKKPLEAYHDDIKTSQLKRTLGKWELTAIGVGAVIGGGIFVLTGVAANQYAGPALALSFILAGIGCLLAAFCYAEFAGILPVSGSAYAYSYGTIGEFFAWFIGWNLILEYMMGATTVAVSWSKYFVKLLQLAGITNLPFWLTNDPVTAKEEALKLGISPPSFSINLPAALIVWVVTYILVRGIKESAKANNIIVAIKVAAVLFVIVAGIAYINPANWQPFIPEKTIDATGVSHFGISGVLTAAGIVFFAFIGFDAVSTQSQEAVNPTRDIPFAIVTSLIICTTLYILVSLTLTGMTKYSEIDLGAPVASAFGSVGLRWASLLITIAAVIGLISVMLVMLLSQTRIFLNMAKDGLLPQKPFGVIHSRFKTPWKSTILLGFISSIVAALTPIEKATKMTSIGTLFAFAMICIAVLVLRFKQPNLHRPFKVKNLPIIAGLGFAFNLFLMFSLDQATWLRLLIWSLIGISIYFLYSAKNSKLNKVE
ncbi:APC family permease [Sediminibacterium goheungense]|uniref:APA family basic amino acid/polyamine antiporter n=1 Tax=Sediminibacterium goheungense TaxID=1086393 RepID=A0A4R6IMT3_9BACT|nr:amino acid permease [Sediminibacterium goheungense]TDO23499.1 APA family basic amino acid/polyamine antiporter [Sediminibacterium goheungense]TDO25102.1 APA family basic amino acid/polyamine antiporter [Sediminibacterium goheungense]